jgi:site-specific DNA recombinase
VACYARVSTEDQAERQTVAAQTEFLRRYCDLHGLPVAGIYVDDGVSGTTPLEDRREGRRLLEDAEAGAFTVVLVYTGWTGSAGRSHRC